MSQRNAYQSLLSPVKIGGLALRNRVVMAPMGVELVEADGVVREPTIARGRWARLISRGRRWD